MNLSPFEDFFGGFSSCIFENCSIWIDFFCNSKISDRVIVFAISLISYLCQSSALGIWLLRMGRFALIYSPSFAPISSSTAAEVGALA